MLSQESATKSRNLSHLVEDLVLYCFFTTQKEDDKLSKLSVDDLPQTGLQVEVLCMIPPGTVTTRIPREEPTKTWSKTLHVKTGVKCPMFSFNAKSSPQKKKRTLQSTRLFLKNSTIT